MDTPYIELFAGSQQVSTTLVHFAADAGVIQEFTPLMLAENGEFKRGMVRNLARLFI